MKNMTRENNIRCDLAVIGAGPAGMMAALRAAEAGCDVLLIERNAEPGKKLLITGKGRCNITNDSDRETFLANIPRNPKFLFSALSKFDAADTVGFFETRGVPLKTERGNRVFPKSDRAADIRNAMVGAIRQAGVTILRGRVSTIKPQKNQRFEVFLGDQIVDCKAVVLATGGLSYPATGSTGDGYRLAGDLGHGVSRLRPSLVPLVAEGDFCASCQGLSLKNAGLRLIKDGREIYSDFGELLFTHFGLSGPMALSASAHIDFFDGPEWQVVIDLKPALDQAKLERRILSDFQKNLNRNFVNSLDELLPQKLIAPMVELTGIDPRIKVNSITAPMRRRLIECIKALRVSIKDFRPIEEAIITSGGINTSEINARDMQSKLVPGLFFAGEIIDVDGYTGGFNLQIALSTGHLAGSMAGVYCNGKTP